MGVGHYSDFLDKLKAAKKGSPNYKQLLKTFQNSEAVNYRGVNFDPDNFKVEDAQRRLQEALRSPASFAEGAKHFSFPMMPGGAGFGQAPPGSGERVVKTPIEGMEFAGGMFGGGPPVTVETIADGTKKDRKEDTVCAECGSAGDGDLKVCGGCKMVRFCSKECQVAAWKSWNKRECKKIQQSR